MNFAEKIITQIYNVGRKITSIRRVPYENISERSRYRESMPTPKNWLEQSYAQYLCQYCEHSVARILLNIICIPVIAVIWIKILISTGLSNRRGSNCRKKSNENCIGVMDIGAELIPDALSNSYGHPVIYTLRGEINFDNDALKILVQTLNKYWHEPHFITKISLRIGRYSHLIAKTKCKIIIASAEYSFASSALTWLCELKSIKHINIMHGEKFINPVDAFCGFHEFYVWDEHYINTFQKLKARVNQYTVAKPLNLTKTAIIKEGSERYDMTYYLGWELSESDLYGIQKSMNTFKVKLRKVCIRMHPYYGNRSKIASIFNGFEIEDPDAISLQESLTRTRAVVSLSTTVFWQADFIGRTIIIDDVSNPEFYKKLHDIDYIWMSKDNLTLSKLHA